MPHALLLLVLLVASKITDSAKILAAMTTFGRSHQLVFEPYLEALAEQGHQVTFPTFFPIQKSIANLTQVYIKLPILVEQILSYFALDSITSWTSPINGIFTTSNMGTLKCEIVLGAPNVQTLMDWEQKFDLVITELFDSNCFDAFAYKFKAPLIVMSASNIMPWVSETLGNPDNPSYITTRTPGYTNSMNFYQRLMNSVYYIYCKMLHKPFGEMRQTAVARQYFGHLLPPLSEIKANASLLFLNTHFSLQGARPLVPGTVEIGGIHIRPSKKLSEDIERFLDESEEGVVYFSMGSLLKSSTFPPKKVKAFLEAFAEIPQRVIWKFETSLTEVPKNVMIGKWLPQNDILGHPNVKVFISHGGLLGTIEAAYNAVPMIGIAVTGEHIMNMKNIEATGMGLLLNYEDISKDSVLAAIKAVLTDPRYRNNATRVSREFKDRPLPPLQTALYWTEYVLRHRGAPQLRSMASKLRWYQYLLFDVAAVILTAIVVSIFVIRRLWSLWFVRLAPVSKSDKKRN